MLQVCSYYEELKKRQESLPPVSIPNATGLFLLLTGCDKWMSIIEVSIPNATGLFLLLISPRASMIGAEFQYLMLQVCSYYCQHPQLYLQC